MVIEIPKAVLTIQKMASSLPKADQAAVVSVPKVLIAAMIAMFVMENKTDSSPVGIPILSCVFRTEP